MPIVVLVVAIGLESFSFRTAIVQANPLRHGRSWVAYVRGAKAPELPVVLLEDLAALLGLVFALFGVGLTLVTENGRWDAAGTALIGLLWSRWLRCWRRDGLAPGRRGGQSRGDREVRAALSGRG